MSPSQGEEPVRFSLPQGRRKRQRNGSKNSISGEEEQTPGAPADAVVPADAPVLENGGRIGRQTSMRISFLRRNGGLMRTSSHIHEEEIEKIIPKETIFMDKLPMKAPFVDQDVCGECGKAECICEPESDSEEEEEERPSTCSERFLEVVRSKTDVIRDYSGRIVNDQGFQIFIVILILLNSLLIGVSTFDFVEDDPEVFSAFRILDFVFLIIFTIELIMQFLYHGYNLFFDGWLVFDLFIVIMSWALESISVLRALRLRSFRIFRVFRITSRVRALRRLVEAIFDVLPKITAIIVLFSLIMYIFGVMCTELFGEIDFTGRFSEEGLDQYDYFSRLDYSLFTLFQMVTLDWAKVTRAVMQVYPWANFVFSIFVTFSSYVLYNLIIAVVCDAVKMVQDQADIIMVENFVKEKIEARHRIINLRQKLDKMSKQQMDLLLYIQLILEQLDDVDEASKQHYEETLLHLGESSENAKASLQAAIRQLDTMDFSARSERKISWQDHQSLYNDESSHLAPAPERGQPPRFERRQRRVFFDVNMLPPSQQHSRSNSINLNSDKQDKEPSADKLSATEQDSIGQNYFNAMEDQDRSERSASTLDESFHSCVVNGKVGDEP